MVSPTAWAHVPSPGIRTGAMQGIQAIAQGREDELKRRQDERAAGLHDVTVRDLEHDLSEKQREAAQLRSAQSLAEEVSEAFKSGDRGRFDTALINLSGKDKESAEKLAEFYAGLEWQNLVEASYPFMGAATTEDLEAQNKLLTQARDTLNLNPSHPIVKDINEIINETDMDKRNRKIFTSMHWLKSQGVFGKPMQKEAAEATQGGEVVKKQKTGAFTIVNQKTGEQDVVVGSYNPQTAEFELKRAEIPKGWELASDIGETPAAKQQRKIAEAGGAKAAEEAVKKGGEFFSQAQNMYEAIEMLNRAEDEVDKAMASPSGYTGTGVIQQYLPAINEGSMRIRSIGNQLGLEVIKSATFGALSEAEMRMAMQTGLERGLDGPQLKKWIQDKREAQQKLYEYYMEAASFIGAPKPDGGVFTQNDWVKLQREKYKEAKAKEAETPSSSKDIQSEVDAILNKYR